VALALTPSFVVLSVVAMLMVASLLDLSVAVADGDALISGERPASTIDVVMVLGAGLATAFAPPGTALVLALRAQRAGYRHAGRAAVLSAVALGLVLALPLIWNPVMALGAPP
jgi:hypothetical protein